MVGNYTSKYFLFAQTIETLSPSDIFCFGHLHF